MMKPITVLFIFFSCLLLPLALQSCESKEGHPQEAAQQAIYTCPMHPEVISDKPGKCPKCKMALVEKSDHGSSTIGVELNDQIRPTNEFVLSKVEVTTVQTGAMALKQEVLGRIAYDTKAIGIISSRVSGRIERLYVRYRYQKVHAGQKIMEIYSPELLTYQQNLLFLLENDAQNVSMINATKERLRVNGVSSRQLSEIIRTRKASSTISIYSNYSGHIHESGGADMGMQPQDGMRDMTLLTEALKLKEGNYVGKGNPVFEVYDPDKAWALLQLYAEQQHVVKVGDRVIITPETAPAKRFEGRIDFVEPFFREELKTLSARVHFDNASLQIPIGSQVKATVLSGISVVDWLPETAVISLGRDKVVFKKADGGFVAKRVVTGMTSEGRLRILSGLSPADTVASNAQFLMDSESFIKVNE